MFEIPADLAPECAPVAWLLGTWRATASAGTPRSTTSASRKRSPSAERQTVPHLQLAQLAPGRRRRARPTPRDRDRLLASAAEGRLEVLLSHPTGFSEIWEGTVDGPRIEIRTDMVARTASAKEYTAGHRLYGLVEGDLMWAFDMAAMGEPLQPHLSARLVRAAAPVTTDDWHAELRSRGYRLTPQRQLVLDAVRTLGHSTPDEIAAAVQASRGRSTCRRSTARSTCSKSSDSSPTPTSVTAPDVPPRRRERPRPPGVHACGASPVPADRDRWREDSRAHGFEVNVAHIAMHGRCAACVAAGVARASASDGRSDRGSDPDRRRAARGFAGRRRPLALRRSARRAADARQRRGFRRPVAPSGDRGRRRRPVDVAAHVDVAARV